jgi:phosphoribosylamine---glycine ligase
MRLLVIDPCKDAGAGALDFAWRAQESGHDVKFFQERTPCNEFVGKGLVDRIDDFNKYLLWADLVFNVDNTRYMDIMARAKADGQSVISSTKEAASWEIDRKKGMELLKKYKIPVPEYKIFSNYDEAIAYVKQTMRRFVSKPCGDGDADRALSYVSKGPADMVFMLERWKRMGNKGTFMLQEFQAGVEMAVGAFVGPKGFASNWCENFEFKKLMNDDIGVNCGESGTVMKFVNKSKLAAKVLKPLEDEVVSSGFTGYIDLNCIIDDHGDVWPLEFTTRCGWPTLNIQMDLLDGNPVEWLKDVADGKKARQFRTDCLAIGVVIAIPDYPYSNFTSKETSGIPIYGLTPSILKNFHFNSVMMGSAPTEVDDTIVDSPQYMSACDNIGVVTATSTTITNARNSVYKRVDSLEIPAGHMYRTDIGRKLQKQLPEIQKHGFATEFRY